MSDLKKRIDTIIKELQLISKELETTNHSNEALDIKEIYQLIEAKAKTHPDKILVVGLAWEKSAVEMFDGKTQIIEYGDAEINEKANTMDALSKNNSNIKLVDKEGFNKRFIYFYYED